MSLNSTVRAERIFISFFGSINAGKSSLINAITNQDVSIVSETRGTTTDPVYKSMEILPLGPVMLVDTAGCDDFGELGEKRLEKTFEVLNKTDIAIVVTDSVSGMNKSDFELISRIKEKNIKYIIAHNKSDLLDKIPDCENNEIYVSAKTKANIEELKEKIIKLNEELPEQKGILDGIVKKGDFVILVTPIDSSAPKGRLILPQQAVLRELLDKNAIVSVIQPEELTQMLNLAKKSPDLVITDSQVFKEVNEKLSPDIRLTSFSILFARYKGVFYDALNGINAIKNLRDGDKILIAEGCTHHRQCNDIGSVKIPKLTEKHTGKKPVFGFSSGGGFPENIEEYKLIIHCGGCMLKDKEVLNRYKKAKESGVPVTNYGMLLAYYNGILNRSIGVFAELKDT